jgi:hypothetical protein
LFLVVDLIGLPAEAQPHGTLRTHGTQITDGPRDDLR